MAVGKRLFPCIRARLFHCPHLRADQSVAGGHRGARVCPPVFAFLKAYSPFIVGPDSNRSHMVLLCVFLWQHLRGLHTLR